MADEFPPALENLIDHLHQLPGIGRKTAQRLAIFLLKAPVDMTRGLSASILKILEEIRFCKECFNITENEFCQICQNTRRDRSIICVVEDIVDIFAIEKSHEYNGLYHVLGGVISPLGGISPEDLRISELVSRLKKPEVREVVLALNPSTEGEATMIYLSKLLGDSGKKITRIASGIPLGSHLEFIDDATIGRAILSRREMP
jgi:recombination protein RecR